MHHTAPSAFDMEPTAAPAMQRAVGVGRLAVKTGEGANRLQTLYQEGCAKIRLPRISPGAPLEAVLINTAGGLTGGDRMNWRIDVGAGASASVTTQACERIYKSSGDTATVSTSALLAAGARLAWLPQETIAFDRSAFARSLTIEMAADAGLLIVEPLIFGRQAMGERVGVAVFRDRWRIAMEGRPVHGEDLSLDGDIGGLLCRPAVAGGAIAMATVLLIADDADRFLGEARAIVGENGGVSAWRVGPAGKLLARLTAESGYALRRRLIPLIRLLNGEAGLPKIWTT